MAVLRRRRRFLSAAFALLLLLLFFSFAAVLGTGVVGIAPGAEEKSLRPAEQEHRDRVVPTRRRRLGVGSSPPACRARCGRCVPCRPVLVVIQPGRTLPQDYYPEAWRCKCGSKLFTP